MSLSGLVIGTYLAVLLVLAAYGFHRTALISMYYRNRHRRPRPAGRFSELPAVTVQLPLYNEMYVAERLLDAVAGIRYPRDRFQIQVLDDSTDETQEICKRKVADLVARFPELDVEYIHRTDRTGFKAGALHNGLQTAKGEFILIFDADFVPTPDILERCIDHFSDPKVAVVQCRWEHVNRDYSALTEVQALMLDGHFIMEHAGRNWSGRFFNFNGTAGMWRRSAIADAGDWQHDTLTEDMDLSYRAQLRGWKFVYLPEIAAPAELPVEMSAFKSQQFRWAKGSVQVAIKLLGTILRSNATWQQKSEAFFHLTNNLAYPLLLVLSLLLLPNLALRTHHGWREVLMIDFPLFFGTTLSVASFYIASQREIALLRNPNATPHVAWRVLARLPLVMSIGIGLCVNQTRAVLEALAGKETEFVRTPKHGIGGIGNIGKTDSSWWSKKYRSAKSVTPFIELGMAAYFVVAIAVAFDHGHYLSLPFLGLFLCGFGYVGWVSLWQGGIGLSMRRMFAGLAGHRGSSVVVPPAYVPPVMNIRRKAVTGEIIIAEAPALRAPETSV
jgi:cellulose synthase/poly-beta-1,6-N-acetylglucosamine synthase-like glycosyltransferase